MTKIGVNNLAVFFSGENLYTFDHLPKGLDPERSVTDDLGQRGFKRAGNTSYPIYFPSL